MKASIGRPDVCFSGALTSPPHQAPPHLLQVQQLVASLRAKVAFSSALQTNLDLRGARAAATRLEPCARPAVARRSRCLRPLLRGVAARALHEALRMPSLWPHAQLSAVEREHVARLDALCDAMHEVDRRLAPIKHAVGRNGGAAAGGAAGGGPLPPFLAAGATEAEAGAAAVDEAQAQLAAHGAEIERLVNAVRAARQHSDAALAMARRGASVSHRA